MSLGGSPPPDNSLALERMRQKEADRLRAEEEAKAAARKAELAGLRSTAADSARSQATNYFNSLGLDPTGHTSDIDSYLSEILGSISPDDPNPGSYFKNFGQSVFDRAQTAQRAQSNRALDQIFPTFYSDSTVPYSLDDEILSGIEQSQLGDADQLIQNMLNRRVITDTGANAARQSLQRQLPTVRTKLTEFGNSTLAQGRQSLDDIINKAHQAASNRGLDQSFDPYSYKGNVDQAYTDFISSLGDRIKAKIPGSLFDTGGLTNIAGAAQGAQNLAFDPNATAPLDGSSIWGPKKKTETSSVNIF